MVHPLGDYAVHAKDSSLTWQQHIASGRFLLALTRDTNANVRVLNGWAVEYRTPTMIYHVLHSNRSRRERPIGPIRTDARFALVSCQIEHDVQECAPFGNCFAVLEAGRIQWGENRLLTSTTPMDLQFQLTPIAKEPETPAS